MSEQWSDLLMTDHQTTEQVFEAVERALAGPGEPAPGLLGDAARYFREYVDGCHNKKEENHLFPLIEQRGIPRSGGPLAVMLMEHEQNRVHPVPAHAPGRRVCRRGRRRASPAARRCSPSTPR